MEIGLLAEVGRDRVQAFPAARVAILSTGNELVDAGRRPQPGQIRNSNGPMLAAQVTEAGGIAVPLGIARDDAGELRRLIGQGLEGGDVLVLSGGVSAGILDLVPAALADLGVREVFHKIRVKPGKPLWFGVLPGEARTLVFGLPGNPVSSLVCFHLFVRPALLRLSGDADAEPPLAPAALAHSFDHRGDRPTYFPAAVDGPPASRKAALTAWKGSADLRSLAEANCLACFSEGERRYEAGDLIDVLMF
jgi:molybdopterin molybdotransferase